MARAHGITADVGSALKLAGLTPTARILKAYPHQLSGGERQRVLIAQALVCRPPLVIADEPFTALDAVRVVELAALFRQLKETTGSGFLVISHSPGVLARIADTVLVMRAGRIVEHGPPRRVFGAPADPYTASLLAAAEGPLAGACLTSALLLLRITGVSKSFGATRALRDVSLTLEPGCALGLVGGSGSGKSTLARSIARFETPDRGEIAIGGRRDYTPADVQLIFQEAAASLNPRFSAEQILGEPLLIQKRGSPEARRAKAREWIEMVGLPRDPRRNRPWHSAAANGSGSPSPAR